MSREEHIIVPERDPRIDQAIEGEWDLQARPADSSQLGGEYWRIFPKYATEILRLGAPVDPDLAGRWLLKAAIPSAHNLVSPYVKLDIRRSPLDPEATVESDVPLRRKYDFRLVSLVPITVDELPMETVLTEVKLLAGSSFERSGDDVMLKDSQIAVSNFRIGELLLSDAEAWEEHFSNKKS